MLPLISALTFTRNYEKGRRLHAVIRKRNEKTTVFAPKEWREPRTASKFLYV